MSLKSILKKIFRIQNDGIYRTFCIFGIKCRFKSFKLRLIRKIETIAKQNDAALRREFESKVKTLAAENAKLKLASETRLKNLETKLHVENEILKRKATLHRMYNVQELFLQQNSKSYKSPYSFNRFDTIVRYLAIENYFGKNDFGFGLYAKMQEKRVQWFGGDVAGIPQRIEKFKSLIESWDKNGYDPNSEIELDANLHLVDGSHRLACALYFGEKAITARVLSEPRNVEYDSKFFVEYDFTKEEIEKIAAAAERILTGWHENYISVILWPPVERYFDEITEKLGLLYEISDIEDFEYNDVIF